MLSLSFSQEEVDTGLKASQGMHQEKYTVLQKRLFKAHMLLPMVQSEPIFVCGRHTTAELNMLAEKLKSVVHNEVFS